MYNSRLPEERGTFLIICSSILLLIFFFILLEFPVSEYKEKGTIISLDYHKSHTTMQPVVIGKTIACMPITHSEKWTETIKVVYKDYTKSISEEEFHSKKIGESDSLSLSRGRLTGFIYSVDNVDN